jgi:hypothetical protein
MDTTLVGVTLISMAMAIGLSVVVWRLLRDERRRSEARIAALAEMTSQERDEQDRHQQEPPQQARHEPLLRRSRPADLPLHQLPVHPAPVATSGAPLSDASGPLFSEADQPSAWPRRAVIMGGLALALTAIVFVSLTARDRGKIHQRSQSANAATVAASDALALLSLRDTRDATTLKISGIVENPRSGTTLKQVTVTAFAFDRSGAFLASGAALLDVTSLAPGDESPFVVIVPVTETVARYRIGFRSEDGRVIEHVDRRQRAAVADAATPAVPGS